MYNLALPLLILSRLCSHVESVEQSLEVLTLLLRRASGQVRDVVVLHLVSLLAARASVASMTLPLLSHHDFAQVLLHFNHLYAPVLVLEHNVLRLV